MTNIGRVIYACDVNKCTNIVEFENYSLYVAKNAKYQRNGSRVLSLPLLLVGTGVADLMMCPLTAFIIQPIIQL